MVAIQKSAVRIASMDETHLHEVMQNERDSYDYPWSKSIFRDCLRAGYSCLIIRANDDIVGHGIFQFVADEAHILNICVAPMHRQMGYARTLLHQLFAAMQNRGVSTVYLEVRSSNTAAISLYSSEGFNEVGIRNGYYRARCDGIGGSSREDALIMARYCG